VQLRTLISDKITELLQTSCVSRTLNAQFLLIC